MNLLTADPLLCRQSPSAPGSRQLSRASSRETLDRGAARLESPSLLRKVINVAGDSRDSSPAPRPAPRPAPSHSATPPVTPLSRNGSFSRPSGLTNGNGVSNGHSSNGLSGVATSSYSSSVLSALASTSSVLQGGLGGGAEQARGEEERLTWLQKQQRKLQERRESQQKSQAESTFLIKELKSSLQRARSGTERSETTDGYASDAASLQDRYSDTSRESSPAKQVGLQTSWPEINHFMFYSDFFI